MTEEKPMLLKVTTFKRILMVILTILQFGIFFTYSVMGIHFFAYPLPWLFTSSSLVTENLGQPSYGWNAALYTAFFIQHGVMSATRFKKSMARIYPGYPFFERYFFNIASGLILIWMMANARPTNYLVFQTPKILNIVLTAIGVIFFIGTMFQKFLLIMFYISPLQAMNQNEIILEPYSAKKEFDLITDGFYKLCRHPLQLGTLLSVGFCSDQYSVDRLIMIAVFFVGVFLGVYFEEVWNRRIFGKFQEYKNVSPYLLIPKVI